MSEPTTGFGSYVVERELGRGGMGIVYLAHDPRLGRPVAIKVLPDAFIHDPERLARFEREARILASLNHPNIGGIFGLEQDGGRRFLVLQYVPGDTVGQRLGRGPLGLDEALDVCRQIAAAVEAAHESGVIHRDLKPGNVKITPTGEVKVLDFGLAKGAEGNPSATDLSQSPTIAFSATGAGVILGTAAYMSPEQARGRAVDRRTDIWSFGCVLFECLTGRQVFAGETVSDTIAQILERAPDWPALPVQTPPKVRELLERCLEKDARKRLRDIGDARIELEAAIAARSTATRMAAARAEETRRAFFSPRALALAGGMLALGAALGIGAWTFMRPDGGVATDARPIRFSIQTPPDLIVTGIDLTPDGRAVVFGGRPRNPAPGTTPVRRLYVRRLDSFEVRPIPGTEGVESYFFSPDGQWIAFRSRVSIETSQRRLAKVSVDGNAPAIALADWQDSWGRGFVWLPGGDILLVNGLTTSMVRVPSSGGPPAQEKPIDLGGASGFINPGNALPRGRGVFVTLESWGSRGYQSDTWLLDPATGEARELIRDAAHATYVPTGHVVFSRADGLYAAPFDPGRRVLTGEIVPLMSGMRSLSSASAYFVVGGGTLFYAPGGVIGGRRQLMVVGAGGDTVPFSTERRAYTEGIVVTADGRRAAAVVANAKGTYEIWIADRDQHGLRLGVALANADCSMPVWAPDGARIAFWRLARDAEDGIYVVRAGSGQRPRKLLATDSAGTMVHPLAWAPDGTGLLVRRFEKEGIADLLFVPLHGDSAGPARPLRATPADEIHAAFSPDGRHVAFVSNESGKYQLYVSAPAPDGALDLPVLASTGAGAVVGMPCWTGDGRRLIYGTDDDRIMSVALDTRSGLAVAPPVELHRLTDLNVNRVEWTALPDGRLLVMRKGEDEDEIRRFDLVANWTVELRERMAQAGARR